VIVGAIKVGIDTRPTRDNHADLGQFFLDDGIGGQGRAHDHADNLGRVDIGGDFFKGGQYRVKEIGGIRGDFDFIDDAFISQQHYVGVGATDIKTNDHGNIPMVEGWCVRPDRAGGIPTALRRAETLTDMGGDVNHALVGAGLRVERNRPGRHDVGPRQRLSPSSCPESGIPESVPFCAD
jgi:hypothetical protein